MNSQNQQSDPKQIAMPFDMPEDGPPPRRRFPPKDTPPDMYVDVYNKLNGLRGKAKNED